MNVEDLQPGDKLTLFDDEEDVVEFLGFNNSLVDKEGESLIDFSDGHSTGSISSQFVQTVD